jgi:acetolactate synthase-1/2/3 large subunit
MANGHFRATGRLAALVTIPGPGFTFAVTGLAEARDDSCALLHVVHSAPSGSRPFGFQQIDQVALARPIVKATHVVREVADVPSAVGRAVQEALEGEPGPVLLEWAPELAVAPWSGATPEWRAPGPALVSGGETLEAIVRFVRGARRPLILAGQGCASSASRLAEVAEKLGAPVLTTASGRGVIPEDHRLALGVDVCTGRLDLLNGMIRAADCVLAIGCKLSFAGTDGFRLDLPSDRLVHVDAGRGIAGATYPCRTAWTGRAEDVLGRLATELSAPGAGSRGWPPGEVAEWRKRLRESSAEVGLEPRVRGVSPPTAARFFDVLRRSMPRDAILVTDSGLHQALARRHFTVLSPRGLILPSDFQSMGFGLPAAIGARIAAPSRPVVALVGDGGLAMSGLEILTAVRERVPLVVVVFVDGYLNRIRLQQLAEHGHATHVEVRAPELEGFARSLGASYLRCGADAEQRLQEAIRSPGVTLVEVEVVDSAAVHGTRVRGAVRRSVLRALGPGLVRGLRRMAKRR